MIRKLAAFIFLLVLFLECNPPAPATQEVPDIVSQHFQYIGPLPPLLNETSGLERWDSTLWTHNDSGDGPFVYQIDLEGKKLLRQVALRGAGAYDWEDMTRDSHYFYLGDFGNNNGNRKNLIIYAVPLDSIRSNSVKRTTSFRKVEFSYEDQKRFTYGPYQHNFDCEAMISIGDSLYLFSKNHDNEKCRLYALGKHGESPAVALLRDTFNTKGTITGAAFWTNEEQPVLALLGYNFAGSSTFYPFVWLFTDFDNTNFFSGKSQRIDLPPIVQMEGIVFLNEHEVMISSEAENFAFAKLYRLDLTPWLNQ